MKRILLMAVGIVCVLFTPLTVLAVDQDPEQPTSAIDIFVEETAIDSNITEVNPEESFALMSDDTVSGECGDNLTWILTSDGTLTISGTGEMSFNTTDEFAPWYDQRLQITNVVMPLGLTSIADYAFYNCENLISAPIPENVKRIGAGAFMNCYALKGVEIPAGVTCIQSDTFSGCDGIDSITIPGSVTRVEQEAFFLCYGLTEVRFEEGVTYIGSYAFSGCSALEDVYIPSSMEEIGNMAFAYCENLSHVYYADTDTAEKWAQFFGDLSSDAGSTDTSIPSSDTNDETENSDDTDTTDIFSGSSGDEGQTLEEVTLIGTYHQSKARSMLDMINDFRTGDEAWYWNSDDTTKTVLNSLSALTYDYDLEQVAMQRAAEIALSFSHTRPNGTICFTCQYNGTYSCGENIAAGYSTAENTFYQWREDNEAYSGQGHRRNMLGDYTSIGIACFEHNGVTYWVQEFGYINSGASAAEANEREMSITIPYYESVISPWRYYSKISFDANGGTGAPSAQWKYFGSVATLSSTVPKKSGCVFLGWSVSATAVQADYQPGDSFALNSDITLYAVWKERENLPGDVDGDGEVTGFDASLILQYEVGLIDESGLELSVADVDGDGEVTGFDASLILQYEVGLIDSF